MNDEIKKFMAANLIVCAEDPTAQLSRRDCAKRYKMSRINPNWILGHYGANPPLDLHDCVDCPDGKRRLQDLGDSSVKIRGNGKSGKARRWS